MRRSVQRHFEQKIVALNLRSDLQDLEIGPGWTDVAAEEAAGGIVDGCRGARSRSRKPATASDAMTADRIERIAIFLS